MKYIRFAFALTTLFVFNSCIDVEDLIYMFDKARDDAYITNQTDCDVTVRRKYFYSTQENPGDSLYIISAGNTLEIPITDRWSMSQHTHEHDTVWFSFSDGTSYFHVAHRYYDKNRMDSIVYEPKDYNILKINNLSNERSENSWTHTKIKGRHYRYDFYITEKGPQAK